MTDFASGFRAGVEAAKDALEDLAVRAKTALRIRCDRCGTTYIEGERHGCAEKTDAPASPAVTAWRALSEEQREEVIDWIRDGADEDDNMLSGDDLDKEDRIAAHRFVVASNAALALLRSLAPEAGDDR